MQLRIHKERVAFLKEKNIGLASVLKDLNEPSLDLKPIALF